MKRRNTLVTVRDDEEKVVCIDCDESTRKDLPPESASSEGMSCGSEYNNVNACMMKNGGQVTSCIEEWNRFRICHQSEKN